MPETNTANQNTTARELRAFHQENGTLMDILIEESDIFSSVMAMLQSGQASVELKKRYMLRAIDETWVNAIEDALPYLDAALRNPSKYIMEREEVLPIEMSKNISPASVKHLAQHTDLISKIEGDTVTPSKLLNVFREETLQTYENKFLNTLINRLLTFVAMRYDVAKNEGQDTRETSLVMEQSFSHGDLKGKMHFTLEIAEPTDDSDLVEKNYSKTTDLWKRVVKIYDIVQTYAGSEFARNMGQSFVRPPIMHTNAIMKNPNMRRCLTLWQFIEGYESAGYSMLIQENLEDVPEAYLRDLYRAAAVQYLNFRYNIRNDMEDDGMLDTQLTDEAFMPRIIDRLKKLSADEFDIIRDVEQEQSSAAYAPGVMAEALAVSLRASEIMLSANPEESLAYGDIPEPEPVPEFVEPESAPGEETAGEAEDETGAVTDETGDNMTGASQETEKSDAENGADTADEAADTPGSMTLAEYNAAMNGRKPADSGEKKRRPSSEKNRQARMKKRGIQHNKGRHPRNK